MSRPAGYRRFLSLAQRIGGTDAELATLLGTSPSTVSRLRAGKIQKMESYIGRMEAKLAGKPEPFEHVLNDLNLWSQESPELRDVLVSLHRIAQDGAQA